MITKQCHLKSLIKKNNKIWEKVEELLNAKFESKPVYGDDDKYMKTNFQGKTVPKENSSYKCLSIITLEFLIKANKKYYL